MGLRVLTVVLASSMLMGGVCSWFRFKPNSRVHHLLGGDDPRYLRTYFAATWEPNGLGLLFLATPVDSTDPACGGALWRYDTTSDSLEELLSRNFCALALSADGRTAVLSRGNSRDGGYLLCYDLVADSLKYIDASRDDAIDVAFSKLDSGKLYYSSRKDGLYSVRLDGSGESLVDNSVRGYFDLTPSDSVVTLDGNPKPRIDPSGRYVIRPPRFAEESWGDLDLIELAGEDTSRLPSRPFEYSHVYYANWSPDGQSVVFTAHEVAVGCPPSVPYGPPGGLWTFGPLGLPE
ncbi:MAG: hypothetical protein JSU73_09695 [candidate division WOR-3 bacterium]|nr:MAG: hypothetical protein JSU73_09695 [candidate division WOR-3 bacterium]